MSSTTDFKARRAYIQELLPGTSEHIYGNGYEIPEHPERFLVIERSEADPHWAVGSDTLEGAARKIEDSRGADDVDVWDLDTRMRYRPTSKVVAFYNGDLRVEVGPQPLAVRTQAATQPLEPNPALPPDPERMNAARSAAAGKSLIMFSTNFGERLVGDSRVDAGLIEQNLTDLIANFGHLCDRQGLKLAEIVARAAGQYNDETDAKGKQFVRIE